MAPTTTTTTDRKGAIAPVEVPDPLKPIRPPARNVSKPQPRMAPGEQIDGTVEIADEPTPPATNGAAKKPTITLSTTVQHRGRIITITATDMTADQFCDLLDRRGFASPESPQQWQTLPDGTPICPKHHVPMRLRERQGDRWYSHGVEGPGEKPLYCKGYAGKDSPGYER